MHYAPFYAESYFFWIGVILAITGMVSVIKPLKFIWIYTRKMGGLILIAGIIIAMSAINWPVGIIQTKGRQKIDSIMPTYSFNEYHEVLIKSSPDKVKTALKRMHVRDIPAVNFLMMLRGIPADKEEKDKLSALNQNESTFQTQDFNYFVMDSIELLTVMLVKTTAKNDPPRMRTIEQFMSFQKTGYIKVALNFRIIPLENGSTLVTTETRNQGLTPEDRRTFGRYWRVIYPGSAIIRRLWLEALAKKSKRVN